MLDQCPEACVILRATEEDLERMYALVKSPAPITPSVQGELTSEIEFSGLAQQYASSLVPDTGTVGVFTVVPVVPDPVTSPSSVGVAPLTVKSSTRAATKLDGVGNV